MQSYPHQSRAAPVAHDFTGLSRSSTVRERKSSDTSDRFYPIDQYDEADDEQTILWGDLFIDMRHLQRLAHTTG